MNRLRAIYRNWRYDRRFARLLDERERLCRRRHRAPSYVWMSGGFHGWLITVDRRIAEIDAALGEEGAPAGVTVH